MSSSGSVVDFYLPDSFGRGLTRIDADQNQRYAHKFAFFPDQRSSAFIRGPKMV